jgi:hypothetical protein
MKLPRSRRMLAVLVVVLVAACTWVWARSAASVSPATATVLKVDTSQPGNGFEIGAVGLSIEASELETAHLSAAYVRLVRLMRLLGPSVLRIGGNSVDSSWWTSRDEPKPSWATSTATPADLSRVRALLAATGWRVLLGVNLGHFEPTRAADEARYAQEILGPDLLGIEIGNEPDDFSGEKVNLRPLTYTVGAYIDEAEIYRKALSSAAPGVAIDGPALTGTPWLTQMGTAARMFTELTQHYYPTSTCQQIPLSEPQPTADGLLSPAVRQSENEVLETLAKASAVTGHPTRIGETNSSSCGGSASASPVFASALWSLDWTLRAASSGVSGLNFHGALSVCDPRTYSPICVPSSQNHHEENIEAQPEYYGLLAARQLEGGRFVPTHLTSPHPVPGLTTWATIAPGGTLKISIDNLATVGPNRPMRIAISGYSAGTEETLIGPSVEARGGVIFGGVTVTSRGRWHPRPARLSSTRHLSPTGGTFSVIVRPASAVIVTLRQRAR